MRNIRYFISGLSAVALVLTASVSCSREDDTDNGLVTLRAGAYVSEQTTTDTRALPAGYSNYLIVNPDATGIQADIRAFLKADDSTYDLDGVFEFSPTVKEWQYDKPVRAGVTYYVYGIMPSSFAQDATIAAPSGGTFANGAVLTIPSLSNVIPNDLNVIVGVKRRMGESDDIVSGDATVNPGAFSYTAPYTEVYLHMLLDHIYSKMTVNFSIDENYDRLRTIKITGCSLKTTSGPATFGIQIPLTANTSGTEPVGTVIYTKDATTAGGGSVLNIPEGGVTLSVEPQPLEAYLCPGADAVKDYELQTIYDVYDKSGNLIRENCIVTNSVRVNVTARGQEFILNAKVSPTYLYQLSDPDFDTPNIKLQ